MLSKFLPARAVNEEPAALIDLDSILTESKPIKWRGKVHYIKPILLDEFMAATEAMARMENMRVTAKEKPPTTEEMLDAYAAFVSSVCDTIGKEEIKQMSLAQVGALVQAIMDHIKGSKEAKKKLEQMTTTTSS